MRLADERERGRRNRGGDEKDRMRGRRDEEQRLTRDERGNRKKNIQE